MWMELRDSGFSRPSYSELRNAFTTRICPKEVGGGVTEGGRGTRKMRESQAERRARRSEKGNPGGQTAVLQHTMTDKTLRHSEPGGPVTASPR